jgi:hypothetical protein
MMTKKQGKEENKGLGTNKTTRKAETIKETKTTQKITRRKSQVPEPKKEIVPCPKREIAQEGKSPLSP